MPPENRSDSWERWETHILTELRRLREGQDTIREDLHTLREGLGKLPVIETQTEQLSEWKDKRIEVCSNTQLEQLLQEVSDLRSFKVKAITVFGFIQVGFAAAISLLAAFGGL